MAIIPFKAVGKAVKSMNKAARNKPGHTKGFVVRGKGKMGTGKKTFKREEDLFFGQGKKTRRGRKIVKERGLSRAKDLKKRRESKDDYRKRVPAARRRSAQQIIN
tara:strand:- start:1681 stop:1995 length:315 start_codon:yes stop_codon:yes gene_type:complete